MKKNKLKVLIVMPAYNAAKTLLNTYNDLPKEYRNPKNIILVDDHSFDETVKLARKLGIKTIVHKKNMGYGGNQKTCYKQALKQKADIVVMLHPDYQYDSSMMKELVRPLEDGWLDVMMGCRIRTRREALENGMPPYKYFFNRFLTILENIVFGTNLGEYHSGYRAYKSKVLKEIPFKTFSNDFIFDQELLASAINRNFRIGEVAIPVRYFDDASSINLKRSLEYGILTLFLLFRYVFHRLGVKKDSRF